MECILRMLQEGDITEGDIKEVDQYMVMGYCFLGSTAEIQFQCSLFICEHWNWEDSVRLLETPKPFMENNHPAISREGTSLSQKSRDGMTLTVMHYRMKFPCCRITQEAVWWYIIISCRETGGFSEACSSSQQWGNLLLRLLTITEAHSDNHYP
jgi:hypothetical protein